MATVRLMLALGTGLIGLLLLSPLLAVLLVCLGLGLVIRSLRRMIEPRCMSWGQLIEFDGTFGWKSRPGIDAYHLADDVFRFTTGDDGWRGSTRMAESEVVVFGDSFAWGYGIDDEHHFARRARPLRVKPVGTMGYNMVHTLLWMERLSSDLRDRLVVWWIYYGNDLYDNLIPHMRHYRAPFLREVGGSDSWEIVTHHISSEPWTIMGESRGIGSMYYEKLAEMCGETFLSQRAYAACAYALGRGRDVCQSSGARLVVMSIPDFVQLTAGGCERLRAVAPRGLQIDVDYPDAQVRRICQSLDIPFVPMKDHLTAGHYKLHDVHWNQHGHARVAEVLAKVHQELGGQALRSQHQLTY